MELKQPMTAQEVYLSEIMGDIFEASKEIKTALQEAKQIRAEINESFSEMEKSISEMNTQVEESIKKLGDKTAATLATKLDLMIQQMTTYQLDSLNKIRDFFAEQGNQLAPEAERTRLENVALAKNEIDTAKQKAAKEITVLIDRINGDKLVTKLIIYAIVFSIASSLITSSLMYIIINNATPVIHVQQSSQAPVKHR